MENKHTVSFCTLGCRVNQYESDAVSEALEKLGFTVVPFGTHSDAAVINTCSVTSESDRKSKQLVRRAVNKAFADNVIVTGCSVQIFPEEYSKIPGVAVMLGNAEKRMIPSYVESLVSGICPESRVSDIKLAEYDGLSISHARRARAYVKIEDGCENKCAYCIIPKGRGKVRSKNENDIIDEVKQIASSCPEIILTGIETASYGKDRGEKDALASLLEKVSEIKGVERLTVGSLDPNVLTDTFLERVKNIPAFLPHLHLSIQSGSSSVLRRMRRKYNAETALERVKKAKDLIPGITFSADIIVGFPGETEEEFSETMEFCKKARFMHLHIFPYSEREGTEAASMSDRVPEEIRHKRAKTLAVAQSEIKKNILEDFIKTYGDGGDEVLFEQKRDGVNIGHSRHYVEVHTEDEEDFSGKIVPVSLISTDGEICFGKKGC